MEVSKNEVVIIGGGIAGLTCAIELENRGIRPLILEATDRVGGRVKTDHKEGYLFDHGFQVLLTAYPEAQQYLNYEKLGLKTFDPGAVIYDGNGQYEISDPLRNPASVFSMAFSPVGGVGDKLKMAKLASAVKKQRLEVLFSKGEVTTLAYLRNYGFSERIISNFFKPFFGGIYLENELGTSSRMFEFVFKMFSEGSAAIPAKGMEEIPKQLQSQLKHTDFRFNTRVKQVSNEVVLENGESLKPKKVVIATQPEAIMDGFDDKPTYQSVLNLYFSCNRQAIKKPLIGLVTGANELINNFCDLTTISSDYSPSGKRLISVSVNDDQNIEVQDAVIQELAELTGFGSTDFEFLASYHIPKALPVNHDLKYDMAATEVKVHDDIFLAGDYLLNASLNAAMLSGRRAAEAVSSSLSGSLF
ncbi:MAG: NAD(P)/FAD-dependent oxidoreductase [Bacteroidota bacterium]